MRQEDYDLDISLAPGLPPLLLPSGGMYGLRGCTLSNTGSVSLSW